MAHYGLNSQQAQERLHSQLEGLSHNLLKIDWRRQLKEQSLSPLVCLGTALAGLALILDFSLSQYRDGTTIFQGLVLLLIAVINAALFCWEVYILETRRIRRLLCKVKPYFNTACPWTSTSYPSQSVNTLKGQCTVHAHRDGTVVNLPVSLVVQGDVVELYKDTPSPAEVTLLDSKGIATATCVKMGELPPPELFQSEEHKEAISFVQDEKRLKFVVVQTPIIATLLITVQKKRQISVLTREKMLVLFGLSIFLLVVVGISFLFNMIRLIALPNDVGDWTEMLIRLQVYTVLPLLHLPLPLVWAIVNLYGTARVVLLCRKGPEFGAAGSGWIRQQFKSKWETVKQTVDLVLHLSMYPNYRVFHILGSLTSLCSIDKEYVLTDSAPVPEKVFFLSRGKSSGDTPLNRPDIEDEATAEREVDEQTTEDGRTNKGEEISKDRKASVDVKVKTKHKEKESITWEMKDESKCDKRNVQIGLSVQGTTPDRELVATAEAERNGEAMNEANSHIEEMHMLIPSQSEDKITTKESSHSPSLRKTLTRRESSQDNRFSQALSDSDASLATPFELVSEILDLSPNHGSPSGLCFDDTDWERYLGSLKPIGVNALATSHLVSDPYAWCPSGCTEQLRSDLCKVNCICPLGIEIGVKEFSQDNFTNELLLYSISDPIQTDNKHFFISKASTPLLTKHGTQPYLVSSALRNSGNGSYLIMSRGSGEMVAACCSDFWDGKDLQPMTDVERGEIEAFYMRRHLTSYCVALAYNPLVNIDLSPLCNQNVSLYVPNVNFNYVSPVYATDNLSLISYSGEQLFSSLLCNQVFLGIVSLQFRPKADIVNLIEELELAGIRFVYFTTENEVRGKIFAEKLGLEAGWNCHISLAPGSEDESIDHSHEDEHYDSTSTSTSTSLSSVINAFQSYVRAKLPKGIHQVRPHLLNVDNVPLQVPLFTDCTVDAIREMVEIMQENGEVVMCMGNSWNQNNLSIFAQADVSLSIIPESTSLQCCPKAKDHDTLNRSGNLSQRGNLSWPSPLEMASYLNTAICQLCIHQHSSISIVALVTESRHVVSCIRHGLLYGLGCSVSLALLMLTATLLFLPPPFSGGHIFWFLLFTIPMMSLSLLSTKVDPKIKMLMPSRKKTVLNEKYRFFGYFFCTFLPSSLFCLFLFSVTLGGICSSNLASSNSSCHNLLGDRNDSSLWNGWRGDSEEGLWMAQNVTSLFFSLYLVIHSIRFIHRTAPIWMLYKFVHWPYIVAALLTLFLQMVYFAISQAANRNIHNLPSVPNLSAVPPYVWVLGLIGCLPLLALHEVFKYQDKTLFIKHQRHLKLLFETKLGMNSPF